MMLDRDLLQIKLAELQIKMQRITTEENTVIAFLLSAFLVIFFTTFTWGIQTNDSGWIFLGGIISFSAFILAWRLDVRFQRKMDAIEKQIQELKKEYTLFC